MPRGRLLAVAFALLGHVIGLPHDVIAAPPKLIDFQRDVKPVFARHCIKCHGPSKQENGLRVDARKRLLAGGDSGEPAIVSGNPEASYLIKLVTGADPDLVMPPKGDRLAKSEIDILRAWIDQGAKMPPTTDIAVVQKTDHWSFQPIIRPDVPRNDGDNGANPIDAFITAKLKDAGLARSPPADRVTLIRRLYFVLHGLPSTPDQIEQFVNDASDDAYSKLVERALKSPRYGERWAQHWLDLIRFGETDGFETNRERPNAWPYRDYVIEALNENKPYDQFVQEQIAGDAIGVDVATGFLVAGPHDIVKSPDINLTLMQRQDELADLINVTGTAFLGLTLGCARCHNHKFDPVSQVDYYAMQAVFAGVQHGERQLALSADAETKRAVLVKEVEATRQQLNRLTGIRAAVSHVNNVDRFAPVQAKFVRFTVLATNNGSEPCIDEFEIFAGDKNVGLGGQPTSSSTLPGYNIHKLEHINDGKYGNGRSWISNERGKGWIQIELSKPEMIDRIRWGRDREGKFSDRLATRYVIEAAVDRDKWRRIASSDGRRAYDTKNAATTHYKTDHLPIQQAREAKRLIGALHESQSALDRLSQKTAYVGKFAQPGPTHRLYRGEPLAKREVVAPDAVAIIGRLGLKLDAPERTRRLRLAEWIVDNKNPLTARVLVNRLWQHHFGTGIVDTPSDFGANGTAPSHPQLLDWLASELIKNGWSTKHLHRLILTSRTFRQSNLPSANGLKVDADSRLLWRFPPRRLEAEAVRDSVLSVSGAIDLKIGGPGFNGFEVQRENVRHYFPKKNFGPGDWRRMIYMTKVRQERESVFGVFDCPDLSQVVPKRSRSTTPLQALNLFNSRFILQQAELLAQRLESETGKRSGQLRLAFQLCFGRRPNDEELADATKLADDYGLPAVCRALLNSNEFLFIP
jgi:mono/diheme cytochrome c family protein